ncbi:MAG: hypothetical protein E6G22_12195 [Actinobacteria bacterium]|nr:MAG: hypothetical protein E6G22_12195 [Actinomycetota bacterium]
MTGAGSRPRSEDLAWLLVGAESVLGALVNVGVIGQRTGFVVAACAAAVNVGLLLPLVRRRWADSSAVVLLLALPIVLWAIADGGAARTWIAGLPAVLVLALILRIVKSRSDAADEGRGTVPQTYR